MAAPKTDAIRLPVPSTKRVTDVPVYTAPAANEWALRNGTLHVERTGFPHRRRQTSTSVYIAGHRLGYPRTESFMVFWDLTG